ncbi:unnamed protein product [Adineta steineri]|uniref:Protein kinase domain-containing protein n=1 Tax=Adineta steineri TaxID=433720 RepID=A0A815MVB4_9BILA|nr:unnamed protein product [Adineta steineri]CAF1621731.1 unnamed protein product [Adineta steineri]
MVIENSPSVITLTPCTIIKLYHEDIFEYNQLNTSSLSSCSQQQQQFSFIKWFRRFLFLPSAKQINFNPMALATSMRLSTPLPTINTEEKSSTILPSNPISTSSITNNNLTKLYKYSQETEMKSYIDQSGIIRQYRQSTERALLAQRKIFLRKKLGEGSFSSVREGFDICHQHQVAIKVIDTQRASKDFQEKFLPRELDIWSRVNHVNIIKMYDHFIECGKIFMILEFASQGDLLTYVQRVGAIPEQKRILWSAQLCDAVKYLHELEVVHRDLKLENLLLDINDNMKLCDFGFSKDVLKCKEYLSKTYCGSRAYVSPEILLGLPYDAKKADVWAIGVILYIFVTGVMPFKEDKNNQLILKQHQKLQLHWPNENEREQSARNLILHIFTYDWQKRPNIQQVSSHAWFTMSQTTEIISIPIKRSNRTAIKRKSRSS